MPNLAHSDPLFNLLSLARRGPGDERSARSLLGEALTSYRALGMAPWAARASALGGS